MKLSVSDLLRIEHSGFRHGDALKSVAGVSIDSRSVERGDIFVAIKGEHFDGHAFLEEAFERGAVGAVVEDRKNIAAVRAPLLVVKDTTRAFGELARVYRRTFAIPILAIAGSNGKTTTKDMIAHILSQKYSVLKTEGNLNNFIGVPQTMLRMNKDHEVAVIEIGTNHPGEISYLCSVLEPTHGLITNVGREHLEFFRDLDGVATEEAMLFEALSSRAKSLALVNADDAYLSGRGKAVKRRFTFGFESNRPSVRGKFLGHDATGGVRFSFKTKAMKHPREVQLVIPGKHNARNALAAAAAGLAFAVSPKRIQVGLESFKPTSRRMEVFKTANVLIYNDTYNANPDSTILALQTLAAAVVPGKRIAVLGDMLELGAESIREHRRIGEEITRLKIEYLLAFGEMARHILETAKTRMGVHYDQKNMLAEYLAELVAPGDAVLVKGSRGMRMEDVVMFLQERLQSNATMH